MPINKFHRKKGKSRKRVFSRIFIYAFILISIITVKGIAGNQPAKGSNNIDVKTAMESNSQEIIKETNNRIFQTEKEKASKLVEFRRSRIPVGKNHNEASSAYAYNTKEIREMSSGQKESNGKKIAFLTFDDGPNHKVTPQVLDVLKKEKVPATFFVLGRLATDKFSDVLKRTINEGHAIALHSFTHDYKKLYPGRHANAATILAETNQSNQALKNVLGENFNSSVFRYPGGHLSWNGTEASDAALAEIGIEWIDWNSLVGDAERKRSQPTTIQGQVDYVDLSLQNSNNPDIAVLLFHDAANKQLTADALPAVIQYLRDKGYSFGILE